MSILKSLFGKKKDESSNTNVMQMESAIETESSAPKAAVDVQSLILLSVADSLVVGNNKPSDYMRDRLGIGFPNEKMKKLAAAGYVRPSTAVEALSHLKVTELKDIATQFGLKGSGKKEEICSRISESVSESDLAPLVKERRWVVTEAGNALLDENKYIVFYMDKHPYCLEDIGLDINTYAKLFSGKPNGRVRDVLWGEFNRRSGDLYHKGVSKGEFHDYCSLLRVMALFLEEENRHKDALAMYFRYLHYRTNFEASLPAVRHYSYTRDVDHSAEILFSYSELLPFISKELLSLSDACGYESTDLKNQMIQAFSKENDTGAFSPTDLAEYIMMGLNGDRDGQQKMCKRIMKTAAKQIPKAR